MINLELGYFIAKFYLAGYFVCFLFSYRNKHINQSNLIIATIALVNCLFNQYLKEALDFYTFYLGAAFQVLILLLISLIIHRYFRIRHEKTTLLIYGLYILIAISFMIIHRVRVVIFDSDENIMWLINTHSVFTLTLYFLSICVLAYGGIIKWKLPFGRLSL
jgi:hypothetical protein